MASQIKASPIPQDLSKQIKSTIKKAAETFKQHIPSILNSIIRSFIKNEASVTSKIEKISESLEDDDTQETFYELYNTLLKLLLYAYKERMTKV